MTTSERLAQELKVSEKTIRRDGEFAGAMDALAKNVGLSFRERVLSRRPRMTRDAVVELAQLPTERQLASARELESEAASR